ARPQPNKTPIKIKKQIEVGEWYHLKVVVEGNDLKWFVNDQLQAETKLKPVGDLDVYKKGKVGIWAWETKASFDDFKVYGPDIEGQAVEPQNKLSVTWGKLKRFY
ncbi:MAG: family 16 glycoside hydrolase, partial [Candidatus Poribacteria bacterium]|nr:family 16 glycoside hydrolase [Candidatus Poribacteria bacterium]